MTKGKWLTGMGDVRCVCDDVMPWLMNSAMRTRERHCIVLICLMRSFSAHAALIVASLDSISLISLFCSYFVKLPLTSPMFWLNSHNFKCRFLCLVFFHWISRPDFYVCYYIWCSQVVEILQKLYACGADDLGLNFINELTVRFCHCPKWVGRQAFAFICQVCKAYITLLTGTETCLSTPQI